MTRTEVDMTRSDGRLVAVFPTESAAWLASARIAANGGPDAIVHRTPGGYALVTLWDDEADKARAILTLFAR